MNVGFAVLSHRSPVQLKRLVRVLGELYGDAPVGCHHDFGQAPLNPADFPAHVRFVQPSIRTGWGKWSLVQAALLALDALYQSADPDIFFLVSAADYPGARPEKVLTDLEEEPADAWIDSLDLEAALHGAVEPGEAHLSHHRSPENIKLAEHRYLRALLKVPLIRFRPPAFSSTSERYPRLGRETKALPFRALGSPFKDGYRCHVGSQWFTARRPVATKLLHPDTKALHLQRHLQSRIVPDECYVQTVLANEPAIRRSGRTHRLAFWDGGGAHPQDVSAKHLPIIAEQQPHFVRKVAEGSPVADELDGLLGLRPLGW